MGVLVAMPCDLRMLLAQNLSGLFTAAGCMHSTITANLTTRSISLLLCSVFMHDGRSLEADDRCALGQGDYVRGQPSVIVDRANSSEASVRTPRASGRIASLDLVRGVAMV
jgi:hypothetical protein